MLYVPEQSFPEDEPSEFCGAVRNTLVAQRMPPWNGSLLFAKPANRMPVRLFKQSAAVIVIALPDDAQTLPIVPTLGVQPREFTFAVQ